MPNPFINDMSLKHDGRVLRFEIFVNSDEDAKEVLIRLQRAGRGQQRNAVLAVCSVYTSEEGAKIWAELQKFSTKMAQNPKSVAVDADGKEIP